MEWQTQGRSDWNRSSFVPNMDEDTWGYKHAILANSLDGPGTCKFRVVAIDALSKGAANPDPTHLTTSNMVSVAVCDRPRVWFTSDSPNINVANDRAFMLVLTWC